MNIRNLILWLIVGILVGSNLYGEGISSSSRFSRESNSFRNRPSFGQQWVTLSFRQSWLRELEKEFSRGNVIVSWTKKGFLIHAVLSDRLIENRAADSNGILCASGDVFEVLIQDSRSDRHFEIQVSPENKIQVFNFPRNSTLKEKNFRWESCVWKESEITSKTRIFKEEKKWETDLFIPFKSVAENGESTVGDTWKISFGRYDYSFPNETPVISSTSPHTVCSFHQPEEWSRIRLGSMIQHHNR